MATAIIPPRAGGGLRVQWWQRISVRIGVGVLLVTAIALMAVGWQVTSQEERLFAEQHEAHAHKIATLLAEGLVRRMLAGGGAAAWDGVTREAAGFIDTAGVGRVLVLAKDGQIKASTDSAWQGHTLEVNNNPACPGCDGQLPANYPVTRTVRDASGHPWLRIVSAVPTLPQCRTCHRQEGEQLRGLVLVDFDLAPLQRAAAQRRQGLLFIGLLAGLAAMALIYWLIRRSVLRPMEAVVATAGRLAGGDLKARAQVRDKSELGRLSEHFNHMAARIEDQVLRLESSNLESSLLYTLVVEVSLNMEMSNVATTVVKVLEQKLAPDFVAFFAETGDGRWVCATGQGEQLLSGEGDLEAALGDGAPGMAEALDGFPAPMLREACASKQLQLGVGSGGLHFALPLRASTHLLGLLLCRLGSAARVQVDESLLANLGGHLTLAVENSRNYTGAVTDPLTHCRNRRYGLARLDEATYGAQRQEAELAVAMVDIDHFKRVNDAYGHPVGDQVLKEVARRLMHAIRKSDVPVRYGGEEFLIILPQTRASEIPRIGERLRQAVGAEPVLADGGRLAVPVSISIGIALFRRDEAGEGCETLLARADQALYQAKAEGRDRVVIAAP